MGPVYRRFSGSDAMFELIDECGKPHIEMLQRIFDAMQPMSLSNPQHDVPPVLRSYSQSPDGHGQNQKIFLECHQGSEHEFSPHATHGLMGRHEGQVEQKIAQVLRDQAAVLYLKRHRCLDTVHLAGLKEWGLVSIHRRSNSPNSLIHVSVTERGARLLSRRCLVRAMRLPFPPPRWKGVAFAVAGVILGQVFTEALKCFLP